MNLLSGLEELVSAPGERNGRLQSAADLLRHAGGYRWVGLYAVDHAAGLVSNLVWSGTGPPAHPVFPISRGLTAAAIASRGTVNVGDVTADPRYLTAFGTTRSEIIVPVLDSARQRVIGTIDVESEAANAFSPQVQQLLETCAGVLAPLFTPAPPATPASI